MYHIGSRPHSLVAMARHSHRDHRRPRTAAAALGPAWHGHLPPALARLAAALAAAFLAERERWALWLPALLGLGIALYFLLPFEPVRWIGTTWTATALAGGVAVRRRPGWLLAAIALGAVGLGFAAGQWRTASVAAPVLAKRLGPVFVTGRVVGVALREDGYRLLLDRPRVPRLDRGKTPRRIRVTVRRGGDRPRAGDRVGLRAVLMPPPAPSAPGAFDFQRRAYFEGLGAVGYAVRGPWPIEAADNGTSDFASWLARQRQRLTERIVAGLPGPAGAVASALMAGEKGAIPADVMAAFRDSGLAHLLAISGLHIGLVAGILFFTVRAVLALVERVALNHPIKKWAALVALAGALGYLLITGATIPTQRAFLMTGLVLLAVMLDRTAVTMRLVAWAAAAILLWAPESLLQVSFQLSFAAVIALVAAYEGLRPRFAAWRAGGGSRRRLALYLAGIALTTLIAGLATGPFAIYHFNRFVVYGLAANLAAVPIMALWIMPWAVAAFALLPVGLEHLALAPMGAGIDAVIWISREVAAWPGAVTLVPAMPTAGLALIAVGGLWATLWRGAWRWLGGVAIAAGLASPALVVSPDILVTGDGKLRAVRAEEGGLLLSSSRASRFAAEIWLRRDGRTAPAGVWPESGPSADGRLRCDSLGCIYRAKGFVVALPRDERALADDCRAADVVVAVVPVRRRCPSARVVIDRFDLWREGAHALWLGGDGSGVRVESVVARHGRRPWVGPAGARKER